ncbi:hypothetical protein CPB85DRAFT_1449024 [Mucidula mucida]|nr:hypothetical protein CPB85DRAFT_1449024 [Mucidula mucida]
MLFQVYEFIASVALLVWDHIICFGAESFAVWDTLEKITIMVSRRGYDAALRVSGIVADILSESIVICVTVLKTFALRKSIADDGQNAKNRPGLARLFLRDGTIISCEDIRLCILLVFSLADMLVLCSIISYVRQSSKVQLKLTPYQPHLIGYDYWVVPYFTPVFGRSSSVVHAYAQSSLFRQEDEDTRRLNRCGTSRGRVWQEVWELRWTLR